MGPPANTPERARQRIDAELVEAGWLVQSRDEVNLSAGRGVAVSEFRLAAATGSWTTCSSWTARRSASSGPRVEGLRHSGRRGRGRTDARMNCHV